MAAAGVGITNAGAAGDFITLIADSMSANGSAVWSEYGAKGTWTTQ